MLAIYPSKDASFALQCAGTDLALHAVEYNGFTNPIGQWVERTKTAHLFTVDTTATYLDRKVCRHWQV